MVFNPANEFRIRLADGLDSDVPCIDHERGRVEQKVPKRLTMDAFSQIEKLVRDKYGKNATTRKAIGDFMLTDSHAINVKSNNVAKQN